MKTHHILGLLIFIALVIVGLFVWVQPEGQVEPTNNPAIDSATQTLQGLWLGEGAYDDGTEWFMRYEFVDSNYTLETDSAYGEAGTYEITNVYENGSVEIEKTYKDGERMYTMVIRFLDENSFELEGVVLRRIEQ